MFACPLDASNPSGPQRGVGIWIKAFFFVMEKVPWRFAMTVHAVLFFSFFFLGKEFAEKKKNDISDKGIFV